MSGKTKILILTCKDMEHKDYEYPDLKVGEDFSTENEQGEVENWKCVGQDEDGCPICERLD
jgi:hypothetical protein